MTLIILTVLLLLQIPVLAGDIIGSTSITLRNPDPQSPISPFAHNRNRDNRQTLSGAASQIVVYLSESQMLPVDTPPQVNPVMDQHNLTIVPHILPVVVGTTVDFPNSDALYHNLFSLSPARKFDLGRYPKGQSKSVTFKTPGEVHIFCDIHPSMSGVILVLPNQYFTMADSDGNFRVRNVPAGKYTINAWHEQLQDVSVEVVVPDTGIVEVRLDLAN